MWLHCKFSFTSSALIPKNHQRHIDQSMALFLWSLGTCCQRMLPSALPSPKAWVGISTSQSIHPHKGSEVSWEWSRDADPWASCQLCPWPPATVSAADHPFSMSSDGGNLYPHLICFGAPSTFPAALRALGQAQCCLFPFISKQLHLIFHFMSFFPSGATLYKAFPLKKTLPSTALPCMHISLPPSSVSAKSHMAQCPCWALPWHHREASCSGAAGVIYPWTQALSYCWKKNIWAISREEAQSVMKVYIKQLLYHRSWKNNFFLNSTVSFPIFFKQKLKHFSY